MSEGVLGQGSMMGFSSETTHGTLVTPATFWSPIERSSVRRKRDLKVAPHLGGIALSTVNSVAPVPRDFATLADNVEGDFTILPTFDHKSTSLLLVHCFGAAPTTTGVGPYTHTYNLGLLPGSTHAGLSLHQLYGYHPTMNTMEQFYGCMVSRFEFACKANDYMRLTVGVIGKSSGGLIANTGTPVMTAAEEMLSHHVGSLVWNSLTIQLNSFKVWVDKKLARRPFLGSLMTDRPALTGLYESMFEAEIDMTASDGYAAYLNETQADGTLAVTGTTNNLATFTFPNMVLEDVSQPIDKAGTLVQRVRGRMFGVSAGTELGLKLALRNDNASAVS